MQWVHRADLDWLADRQRFLCASDVKSLIPLTKTGRPRKVGYSDYLQVLASKLVRLTGDDCVSTGRMARGHLLEPYAVESFNALGADSHLFHWDDKVLSSKGSGFLGFSPDALDVPMDDEDAVSNAKVLGEVKSYDASRHLVTAQTPVGELEERWQIATAMAVSPSIERAYLILYNPDIRITEMQLCAVKIDRSDLESEIETVLEVERQWNAFIESDPFAVAKAGLHTASSTTSDRIALEIEARQNLNP